MPIERVKESPRFAEARQHGEGQIGGMLGRRPAHYRVNRSSSEADVGKTEVG